MKKALSLLMVFAMALTCAGCATQTATQTPAAEATVTPVPEVQSGIYTPGTYSATEKGFGGDVTVTVEVDANSILNVTAVGESETDGVGSKAIDELPAAILTAQGTEVDSVSGASFTSEAVLRAAQTALNQAMGAEAGEAAVLDMTPGTYTASAEGFGGQVKATVTVSENKIESIDLENIHVDNPLIDTTDFLSMYTASMDQETSQMFVAVEQEIPERILKYQSLDIDVMTGATASSKAAISAVEQACVKAGADINALYTDIGDISTDPETYDCDIVIVGAGTSGCSAAAEATEQGAKVVLVEKSARIGGSGALSTGPIALNSQWQLANSQTGDAEGVFNKFEELAHWSNKAFLFRELLDKSGDTADWLTGYGFEWNPAGLSSIPGEFGVTGVSYMDDAIATMGVYDSFQNLVKNVDTILTETTANSILTDANGNAVGIKATRYDGTQITVNAKKVIIATGGFGGNKKMLEEKVGAPYTMFGLQQNVGEGFEMMLDIGAAERNASAVSCHLVTVPGWVSGYDEFDTNITYALGITPCLIQVNSRGERFASETVSEDDMLMGADYHAAQGAYYFTLVSQSQLDVIMSQGAQGLGQDKKPSTFSFEGQAVKPDVAMPDAKQVLDAAVDQGLAYYGDTLEELAEAAGMNAETLVYNVERYNSFCETGEDTDFQKNPAYLSALGEGGYYAIVMIPKIYGTLGSVSVDRNCQVLNADDEPIGNLYAVGLESIGNLFDGVAYTTVGGVALGWAFNSGRIAADAAVASLIK